MLIGYFPCYTAAELLSWPKSLFWFLCYVLWKNLNHYFGQPSICKHLETGGGPQKGDAYVILGEDETAAGFS